MLDNEHPKKPGEIGWECGTDGCVTSQGYSPGEGQTPGVPPGYPSPAQSTWDIPQLLPGNPGSP